MAIRVRLCSLVAAAVFSLMPTQTVLAYPDATTIHYTFTGSFATAEMWARRDGYGAQVRIKITDQANDGDCVFAITRLNVDQQIDPAYYDWIPGVGPATERRTDNCKGPGQTVDTGNYRLNGPQVGSKVTEVRVHFCRDRSLWPDECSQKFTYTLPQHPTLADAARRNEMQAYMNQTVSAFATKASSCRSTPTALVCVGYVWTTDYCSLSFSIPKLTSTWKERFKNACVRHDWGYRNYGGSAGGRTYVLTDAQRQTVDSKFKSDMNSLCAAGGWSGCGTVANGFYQAVRLMGTKEFYGR